jgi:hypothetical protein
VVEVAEVQLEKLQQAVEVVAEVVEVAEALRHRLVAAAEEVAVDPLAEISAVRNYQRLETNNQLEHHQTVCRLMLATYQNI